MSENKSIQTGDMPPDANEQVNDASEDVAAADVPPIQEIQHQDEKVREEHKEEDEELIESLYDSLASLEQGPIPMRASVLRRPSAWGGPQRLDHLHSLMVQKRASVTYMQAAMERDDSRELPLQLTPSMKDVLTSARMNVLKQNAKELKKPAKLMKQIRNYFPETDHGVSIRISNLTYTAKKDPSQNKIETVYNQSVLYDAWTFLKRLVGKAEKPKQETQNVLNDISLNFVPGKMYLILGPPGSGKTTLLKAVAGRLSTAHGETIQGEVKYNGLCLEGEKNLHVQNFISFVGQLDFHAPRLTVKETFDFAFQCKSGGTHIPKELVVSEDARRFVKQLDEEDALPKSIMEFLGLDHVADTFVGNGEIRGISGGQRRRVTVGEMIVSPTPVFCGDEISNGLDSASTYDIISSLMYFAHVMNRTRVISLLQPSPEAVSLFDEIILVAEGQIIYAGPVDDVEGYFADLGYRAPETMDIADFCQEISTSDGACLFEPSDSERDTPYTTAELADIFRSSKEFQRIKEEQKQPWEHTWTVAQTGKKDTGLTPVKLQREYANSGLRATRLNLIRNMVIWSRDKRFLVANAVKNIIMGISVGGVFFQTSSVASIYGVLFQLNLFIMLGAMTSIPEQVNDRIIFYRHTDANFYGAFSYAIGKAVSLLPQSLCDVLIFGTICYFMVGLTTSASNFFIYIALLFVFSVVMNQQLAIFTAIAENKSGVQACSAVILLFFVVFCGFLVSPDVIPNYYTWLYWWNPLAWAYRGLVLNEFTSSNWDWTVLSSGQRAGDMALEFNGFVYNGGVFGKEWIGYAFAYLVPYAMTCTLVQSLCLEYVRVEPRGSTSSSEDDTEESDIEYTEIDDADQGAVEIPFKPVTLTFTDICYDVKASTRKAKLRLLNDVNGIFKAGRMCALMGSSGAGKTTLMDVIALRKTTGTVQGDVRLNGYKQEKIPFRRCSGYVEQFDVQSAELTVRETVLFSARLRLNSEDPNLAGDEIKQKYTDQVLRTLELTSLADCVVGTDGEGGLSFEQRKRLSIAAELAASPSIIFLDEPTSGLDSRAALLVVTILRKIANQGRTVIATIHQPSSSVFEMFDDLLLLKKGGRTVFFGELGIDSCNLVKYFEDLGAKHINRGENPANWMLTVITKTDSDDLAEDFIQSPYYGTMKADIQATIDVEGKDPDKKIVYATQYAAPNKTRMQLLVQRVRTIYWRSPAYNLLRMLISIVIAFVLGSIFVTKRLATTEIISESYMTSILSIIFISFIIIGVMSMNSVLPVMLDLRDNFYRQRAAGMYGHSSLAVALGMAEQIFIIVSSLLFCVIFMPCVGLGRSILRSFAYWGFFTFNVSIYSYFGQAFVACVPTVPTAQILAAVFIGLNNFFSGLIVRPQYITGFFSVPYWITPGHFVYEGLVIAAFTGDERQVLANPGSPFYDFLKCDNPDEECYGTIDDYIAVFFGGEFQEDHLWYDIMACALFLVLARCLTFFALKYFNYTGG